MGSLLLLTRQVFDFDAFTTWYSIVSCCVARSLSIIRTICKGLRSAKGALTLQSVFPGAEARAKAEEAAEIDALDPFSLASPTDSSADDAGPKGVPPFLEGVPHPCMQECTHTSTSHSTSHLHDPLIGSSWAVDMRQARPDIRLARPGIGPALASPGHIL